MPDRPTSETSDSGFPEWDIDIIAELRGLRDQGAGDSAQATMLRVVWLRQAHPGATIDTESIRVELDLVVIRAAVTLADGTAGSGFAAELTEDHASLAVALETAETRAIGRALDILGLILPPDAEPQSRPAPIRTTERTPQTPPPPAETEDPPAVVDALRRAARSAPRSIRPVDVPEQDEPAPRSPSGDVRFTVPTPFPQRSQGDDGSDEGTADIPSEDYSWTSFWRWAREKGLMRKIDIEQRIGRSIDDMNPAQIRLALRDAGIELS